jgi:hypothetical protein
MYEMRQKRPAALQYARLLEIRGNESCAVCGFEEDVQSSRGRTRRLVIDHDHDTGIVRDLLCNRCNKALGLFRDDIEIILVAAQYLARHRDEPTGIVFHALEEPAA